MKTAIALRHIHFEDVGTLDTVLAEQGYQLKYIDPTIDHLDDITIQQADLLIVLGGPVGAYDEQVYPFLVGEMNIVRQRLEYLFGCSIDCQSLECQSLSTWCQGNWFCAIDIDRRRQKLRTSCARRYTCVALARRSIRYSW